MIPYFPRCLYPILDPTLASRLQNAVDNINSWSFKRTLHVSFLDKYNWTIACQSIYIDCAKRGSAAAYLPLGQPSNRPNRF